MRNEGAYPSFKATVVEVHGGVDAENRDIVVESQNGGTRQKWDLIYVKDWKEKVIPKDGELNPDYGLRVNRDFHIISLLGAGRYIDYVGGYYLTIKTQNGRKSQRWFFDQKSLTIKSREQNQSITIPSNGLGEHLLWWKTSSAWY